MSTIMEEPDTEAILAGNLRMEREARGWTLTELAARSGVSRAMLSKIERCEASPTAALLGRLSAAFGLTMSQLFARIEDQSGGQVARADQQPVWKDPDTGFVRRSLSPPGPGPLELVWGEMPPGAEITYPAASRSFIADQQLVMVSGNLTIVLGTTSHLLEAGDCLRFGPPKEVTFRNPGAARCRYVIALLRVTEYPGLRRADNGSRPS
jgi:transcriptional regulator with XRE-family HTH domain